MSYNLTERRDKLAKLVVDKRRMLEYIFASYPDQKQYVDFCMERAKNIAVILGNARGGTSVFKDVLAANQSMISMIGEHRLFFTLLGLNFPDHGGRTEHCTTHVLSEAYREFILKNLFYETRSGDSWVLEADEVELYALNWAMRLPLQWVEYDFDSGEIVRIVVDHWNRFWGAHSNANGDNRVKYYVTLLHEFRRIYSHISPAYYDFGSLSSKYSIPDEPNPDFYKSRIIVEITPYILVDPQKRQRRYVDNPTLLLKASSDCYRIGLLSTLFSDRTVRYIHLTRNPLSSINGLLDGWDHHCFGQHDLDLLKQIGSHENSNMHINGSTWKFDLFEGWESYLSGPLLNICIRQWISSNRCIFNNIKKLKNEGRYIRVKFERFQENISQRKALFDEVLQYLGIRTDESINMKIKKPRVINASAPPRTQRWRDKREQLVPVLTDDELVDYCGLLGYEAGEYESWL
jgi:hypothetical protein